ncbi:ABC transporter ATP-binding protein [Variovorax sp. RHLX14]|uniref:ABC transporter ATP-binding protein n=1 Tax=Variovorax sp. RHLX14 TaxID=1259731 RepID=UPI003F464423
MTTSPLLEVRGLCVEARSDAARRTAPAAVQILQDVNLRVEARQVLGIIGESGAGKTVLARALAGWLPPALRIRAGQVLYKGVDMAVGATDPLAALRGSEIGYIGSDPVRALDPTVTIGAQIAEKLRAVRPGTTAAEAREKVVALLAAVRIPAPAKRYGEFPFQFSGGMMQRVMIADALISDPALLIADNITQPLDVTVAAQILRLLRELGDSFGTSVVFVSSSLPVASQVSDNLVVLQAGRVIERGEPQRIATHPVEPYTRELLLKIPEIWTDRASETARAAPAARIGDTILKVENVSKLYRVRDRTAFNRVHDVQAVRNITFSVARGESIGIVGESGCGKSTLTRLLTLLERPDTGTIEFDGQDLGALSSSALRALRPQFQLLLQDPYNALPSGRTIGEIISEPLSIHRIAKGAEARQRVLSVMNEVGLPASQIDALPVSMSAGQRQRINIARALALEPKLMVLDETLSSLDQVEQSRLIALFERLHRQHGLTYIYISHDLAMVRRVCTRVAVMYLGEIVELSPNEMLFRNPGHPYSKALLSAIPTLEAHPFDAERCLLDGEPPSPIDLPVGCSFANRCPVALERCTGSAPAAFPRGEQAFSRCFLTEGATFAVAQ